VGRLAAGVAHEVGNPLSGIMGYLSLARSEAKQNPKLLDYLGRIDAELLRIDGIVKSLLDLGRPAKMQPSVVDIARTVESCHLLLSKGKDFEGVELSLLIEPGLLVSADASALSQVFINLLLNAAQAMEAKGRITVRGTKEGSWAQIEVQDTGPGIPSEILPRIFDPFFTTKSAGRGTGLGLAVCQHLVAAMGGQLSAGNAEGGGALISMKLPAGYVTNPRP
jgi:signal transduction histidine kinase